MVTSVPCEVHLVPLYPTTSDATLTSTGDITGRVRQFYYSSMGVWGTETINSGIFTGWSKETVNHKLLIAQAKKQPISSKLGQMSFSSLDWDILISSFQKIPWPSSNYPPWKTFEVRNCKDMENTLKIKVIGKSILFCKYLRNESSDNYWMVMEFFGN